MTLVAIWVNKERGYAQSIWTIADTKISSGPLELTSQGSKVFELTIACKTLGGNAYGEVYYQSSLSFAYAGSSLAGLNVYATLQSILNSLGGGSKEKLLLPDHVSIANKAKEIVILYSRAVQDIVEVAISGFCPKSGQPFISIIRPVMEDGMIQYQVDFEYSLKYQMVCVLLGNHRDVFNEILIEKVGCIKDISDYKHWRTPISTLYEIINDGRYDSIGGSIQVSTIDDERNFTHMGIIDNVKEHTGAITYRNIDLFSTLGGTIGDCLIAIPAVFIL